MDWADAYDICIDCKKQYAIINEDNHNECRCIDCQTRYRIELANQRNYYWKLKEEADKDKTK